MRQHTQAFSSSFLLCSLTVTTHAFCWTKCPLQMPFCGIIATSSPLPTMILPNMQQSTWAQLYSLLYPPSSPPCRLPLRYYPLQHCEPSFTLSYIPSPLPSLPPTTKILPAISYATLRAQLYFVLYPLPPPLPATYH